MSKKKNHKDPGNEKKVFVYEGTIVEPIKNIMFHVRLNHNNETVLGYLSGNMRRHRIHVLLGDRDKAMIARNQQIKEIQRLTKMRQIRFLIFFLGPSKVRSF